MARFKAVLMVFVVGVVNGCYSSAEDDARTRNIVNGAPSNAITALFNGGSLLDELTESDEAVRIARSYPEPKLPNRDAPFAVQPDTRFDQWVLSSMTKDPESKTWSWTRQEFFRVALSENNATESPSNWAFTDIIGQRFTQHNFSNTESVTDASVERVALGLASVASDSIALNNVSLTIENEGCQSILTVQRMDKALSWQSGSCPERAFANGVVFGSTATVLPNGISWVSRVYGQLPEGTGAVHIDRLEVLMPDGQLLKVSRSRRRSGQGPVTITGSLDNSVLIDMEWQDTATPGALYPTEIVLTVPSLSQTFLVAVPDVMHQELAANNLGAQHGVLVASNLDNTQLLPGVLLMNPLLPQEL